MFFDVNNLFFHVGNVYQFTAGEFVSLATLTASSPSSVISLGVAEDLGIGDGEFIPKVAVYVGTGVTSACTSLRIGAQFQGSTDSSLWTTYAETCASTTASFQAGYKVFPLDVPRRPSGVALPKYYRLNLLLSGNANTETISAGTLIGGIVIQREDSGGAVNYPSGFSVI